MSKFYERYKQEHTQDTYIVGSDYDIDNMNARMNRLFRDRDFIKQFKNSLPDYSQQTMKEVTILEQTKYTITIKGFKLMKDRKLYSITFNSRHQTHTAKITDYILTPEVGILYVDHDTRDWPYTKNCFVKWRLSIITQGLLNQMMTTKVVMNDHGGN